MKFGVLKVTNQPRNVWKGKNRWHAGTAVDVRANVRLAVRNEDGTEIPIDDRLRLSWYSENWDIKLRERYAASYPALDDAIGQLEEISIRPPLLLDRLLKNETKDMIQVGENEAEYLWLFFTIAGTDVITPVTGGVYGWKNYVIGSGHLLFKVTIFSEQGKLFEAQYALTFKAWNNFSLTQMKE